MGIIRNLFLCLVPIAVAMLISNLAKQLDVGKAIVPKNHEECKLTKSPMGAEDITRITRNVILMSSDDRFSLWHRHGFDISTMKDGGFYVADVRDNTAVYQLPIHDFPEGVALHPHGIFLIHGSGAMVDDSTLTRVEEDPLLLYAVNHAYTKGGERIEVFALEGDIHDAKKISLRYKFSLQHTIFDTHARGILNDLVVMGPGDVYVTRYQPFPDAVNGREYPETVTEHITKHLNIPFSMFSNSTGIYHVTHDPQGKVKECVETSTRFRFANGVSRTMDGSLMAAVDIGTRSVNFLRRRSGGDLEFVDAAILPHAADNIEIDFTRSTADRTEWSLGTILQVKQFLDFIKSPTTALVAGGLATVSMEFTGEETKLEVHDLVRHTGDQLSAVASGIVVGNKAIMGSWGANGLLICDLPAPNAVSD